MSRRSELLRIRQELAEARIRTLAGPHGGPPELQPLLGVVVRRIGEVTPAWKDVLRAGLAGCAERTPASMPRDLALGVELIYEGWALHAGASRLTTLGDGDEGLALLIGDWCYAAGLCDVADSGSLDAVACLSTLIADLSASSDEPAAEQEARWDRVLGDLSALASGDGAAE